MSRAIPLLAPSGRTNYNVIPAGNEPENLVVPEALQSHEPFVLVSTGCFRIVDIARSFCADDISLIRKIIVIDNSEHVEQFWILIKTIFAQSRDLDEVKSRITAKETPFKPYLTDIELNVPIVMHYFIVLLDKISQDPRIDFAHLQNIVASVEFILQDWTSTDADVFTAIQEHCDSLPVFAYISNIASMLEDRDAVASLHRNLELLKPTATLYANSNSALRLDPENFCFPLPTQFFCTLGAATLMILEEQSDRAKIEEERLQTRAQLADCISTRKSFQQASSIDVAKADLVELKKRAGLLLVAITAYEKIILDPPHFFEQIDLATLKAQFGTTLLQLSNLEPEYGKEFGDGKEYIDNALRFFQGIGLGNSEEMRALRQNAAAPAAAA